MRNKIFHLSSFFLLLFFISIIFSFKSHASTLEMKIYGIYLGDKNENAGDCTLVESNGRYLLMDLGSESSYSKIRSFLRERGITKLDLYISHMHADHTGGLRDNDGYDRLLHDFNVEHVYIPDKSIGNALDLSWNYSKITSLYQEAYPDRNITKCISYLKVGSNFNFGSVSLNVIGPLGMSSKTPKSFPSESIEESENIYLNNCSLVSILTCGNTKFFTGGDIDTYQEKQLANKYGNQLRSKIYKMSHHGYSNSNTNEILQYIKPTYTFTPNSGKANRFTGESTKQRKTYTSMRRCNEYGFVYLIGSEQDSSVFCVSNNSVKIYRASNISSPLSGYTKVIGSDGIDEIYDHYLFDVNGIPLTGIQTYKSSKYYFGKGGCQEYGLYLNGKYNSWKSYQVGKNKYFRYYDKKTHEMKTGLITTENGDIYFCDPSTGYRTYGFQTIKGNKYYFGNAGTMYKNKWLTQGKKRYYFNNSGIMATGLVKVSGKKMLFDNKGVRSINSFYTDNTGNKYYFGNAGTMYKNKWLTIKDNRYYFDKTGIMATGKVKVGNVYIYFDNDGHRGNGITQIGNKYYYISDAGQTIKKNFTVTIKNKIYRFNNKGILTNAPSSKTASIKSVSTSSGGIIVKWNKTSSVNGYGIYISNSPKGNYKLIQTVDKSESSTKISPMAKGKYYLKIASYKQIGDAKFFGKLSKSYTQVNVK